MAFVDGPVPSAVQTGPISKQTIRRTTTVAKLGKLGSDAAARARHRRLSAFVVCDGTLQRVRRHRRWEGSQAGEAVHELFQLGFALRIGGVHGADRVSLAVEPFDKGFGSCRKG